MRNTQPPLCEDQLHNWKLLQQFQRHLAPRLVCAGASAADDHQLTASDYLSFQLFALLNPALKSARSLCVAISTALTPHDRSQTVARVKERLAAKEVDWTLVATSCVEAGVDFSFRTAFRESWGLVNLLQIAGRASRSGEFDDAEFWDFRHDAENGFSLHPQAKLSRCILEQVFAECTGKNRQAKCAQCFASRNGAPARPNGRPI